jgi:hypothetical protein
MTEALVTIVGLIVTVAIVSVVVSKKAQTPAVLQAAGSAFSNALGVAESPVTGASYNINLSYPGTDMSGSFGTA